MLFASWLRIRPLGRLYQRRKPRGVIHGEVGQHLAVEVDQQLVGPLIVGLLIPGEDLDQRPPGSLRF